MQTAFTDLLAIWFSNLKNLSLQQVMHVTIEMEFNFNLDEFRIQLLF